MAKATNSKKSASATAPIVVEAPPPAPVVDASASVKPPRHRRMPRVIREKMVVELDRAITLLLPVAKTQRKSKIDPALALTPKEAARQVTDILKTMRASLRVRTRNASVDRPTSVFNLFVRETMRDMKANGIVFANTTERMKECGRLWALKKEEVAAAAAAAAGGK